MPRLKSWTRGLQGAKVGVIHCFSGDENTLEQYLAMGFSISLGAYIGYPSSASLRSVVRRIPADRLLLETDCPYLPPQGRRGQRNEPAYLPETARLVAEIRGVSPDELARETTGNAVRLFRLAGSG